MALLENDARLQRDGRRGGDWAGAVAAGYRLLQLTTWRFTRGEEAHFTLRPFGRLPLRSVHAVLLGGWDSPAFWQTLVLAKLLRIRTVGFYESTEATNHFRSGPIAAARTWFFRHLDAVVVPGASSAALLRSFGVPESRTVVGFNAVDVAGFARDAAAERAAHPDASDGHRFVYVGQLIERKNVASLVEAFAAVREPGDTLTIVGTGDGQPALEAVIRSLGIVDAVHFAGSVPNTDLAALLAHQHTLVLPSSREVWGLVVNEALACGLQTVISETAGVAESVRDMAGVFLVASTPDGIAAGLRDARQRWSGPIVDPAILEFTPAALADAFARALGVLPASASAQ